MSFRPLRAEICLENLRHNYRLLRSIVGKEQFFCPMLKANAYGHGDIEAALALSQEGADCFGVALVEEGVRLREHIPDASLLVFHPFADLPSARAVVAHRLTPVLSSWDSIRALESAAGAGSAQIEIHLKFNTGMARLGFAPSEAEKLAAHFRDSHRSLILRGICTHLFAGEDALQDDGHTSAQLKLFSKIFEHFKSNEICGHVLNSSACLARFLRPENEALKHWGVRPGLSLYGVKASVTGLNAELKSQYEKIDLRPVMRVISEVVHAQRLANGDTVSYGGRYQVKRESTIGVVPIGYADGYMRRLSGKANMSCRGRLVPVAGTVCMDFTMIDMTAANASVGDEVVVLGAQNAGGQATVISAQELADLAGTNAYEILTNFSARVPRIYV